MLAVVVLALAAACGPHGAHAVGQVPVTAGSMPILPVRLPTASSTLPPSCADGTYRRAWGPWLDGCPGFVRCAPGFYCRDGVQKPCLEGHYGASEGQTEPTCDGKCAPGHYCTQVFNDTAQLLRGSVSPTQNRCGGDGVYCEAGSVAPTAVTPGYYTTSSDGRNGAVPNATRDGQRQCEVGHFCVNGIKEPCPAGRFGDVPGLSDPSCSGVCMEGYYCPSGSISATQVECKAVDEYCPQGSGVPSPVFLGTDNPTGGTGGHYTLGHIDVEGEVAAGGQVEQALCPLGHYCKVRGAPRWLGMCARTPHPSPHAHTPLSRHKGTRSVCLCARVCCRHALRTHPCALLLPPPCLLCSPRRLPHTVPPSVRGAGRQEVRVPAGPVRLAAGDDEPRVLRPLPGRLLLPSGQRVAEGAAVRRQARVLLARRL